MMSSDVSNKNSLLLFLRQVTPVAIIALSLLFLWFVREVLLFILMGFILSMIGKPLMDVLSKIRVGNKSLPRIVRALITILAVWGVLVTVVLVIWPLLVNGMGLIQNVDLVIVEQKISVIMQKISFLSAENQVVIAHDIIQTLQSLLDKINFTSFISSMVSVVVAVFATTFISFFFLKDENLFEEILVTLTPNSYVRRIRRVFHSILALLSRYFLGMLLDVLAMVLMVSTGMMLVGVGTGLAVTMGVVAGICNVIPYVGPWFAAITCLVMYYTTSVVIAPEQDGLVMFYILLVFITAQVIDAIFFQPSIYAQSVKAHPLEIFIVILSSGVLVGPFGMIFAIPVYTILRVFAREFFHEKKVVQKLTKKISSV